MGLYANVRNQGSPVQFSDAAMGRLAERVGNISRASTRALRVKLARMDEPVRLYDSLAWTPGQSHDGKREHAEQCAKPQCRPIQLDRR
ncbi:MAG: hypothetical protein Rubg2KO_06660 [Rubricoccaceae bacterium]